MLYPISDCSEQLLENSHSTEGGVVDVNRFLMAFS